MVDRDGGAARWRPPGEDARQREPVGCQRAEVPGAAAVTVLDASAGWDATLAEVRRAAAAGRAVVVLAPELAPARALEALWAGAGAVLPADVEPALLTAAAREVLAGGCVAPPDVLRALVARWRAQDAPAPAAPHLSPREREVLSLVSRGLTTPEVARVLGLSSGTVRTHLEHLFRKLDVTRRTEAVREAARLGLLPP